MLSSIQNLFSKRKVTPKDKNNQDNTIFQRKKEELRKNVDKVGSNVRGSKLVNKEPTNNEDSHNTKSKEYNNNRILLSFNEAINDRMEPISSRTNIKGFTQYTTLHYTSKKTKSFSREGWSKRVI